MVESAAAVPAGKPANATRKQPWDQHKGENVLWYARFLRYVALGPRRSVSLVATGKRNSYPVPAHWPIVASQNSWRGRSVAFDEAAKKDPALIDVFNRTIALFATEADEKERSLMTGLTYSPPEVDDDDEDEAEPTPAQQN